MKRVNVGESECPISQSVERVGDWWSLLLVLDAFLGFTRFEQFQENLRISPGMLTRRLKTLVKDGVPERRKYNGRPPRYEYVLTASGHELLPLLVALYTWGSAGSAPDARSMLLTDRSGRTIRPLLDRRRHRPAAHPRRTPSSPPVPPPARRSATTSTTPPNFSAARAKKGEMRGNRLLPKGERLVA